MRYFFVLFLCAVDLSSPTLQTTPSPLICIDAGSDWIKIGVSGVGYTTTNAHSHATHATLRVAMVVNERGERKWPALVGLYETLAFSDDALRLLVKGHPGTVVGHVKEELDWNSPPSRMQTTAGKFGRREPLFPGTSLRERWAGRTASTRATRRVYSRSGSNVRLHCAECDALLWSLQALFATRAEKSHATGERFVWAIEGLDVVLSPEVLMPRHAVASASCRARCNTLLAGCDGAPARIGSPKRCWNVCAASCAWCPCDNGTASSVGSFRNCVGTACSQWTRRRSAFPLITTRRSGTCEPRTRVPPKRSPCASHASSA
jgi:hypothetical protein